MKDITCFCEHTFSVEIPETINIQEQPGIKTEILNGTFLTFTCPKCGSTLKPEFSVRLIDNDNSFDLYFVPELERNSFMMGKTSYSAKNIVIGFPELQEKFKIYEAGLDERTIELIKVHFLERARTSHGIHIYFGKQDNDHLFFYIEGLKDTETAITQISSQLYTSFKHKVDTKTYDKALEEMLTPPYISIEKIRFEGK